MRWLRGFSLLILTSFVLLNTAKVANGLPSKPPTVQSHKPTANNRNDANEGHPPQIVESPFETEIVEALRAIERQQQTARTQDQANEKRWWPPSPSWAIVYVTVVYVAVAIFQWSGIRRQADIAETTLKMLAMAERAWIAFQPGKIEGLNEVLALWDDPDKLRSGILVKLVTISYSLINCGKTPAHIDAAVVIAKFVEIDELPEEPNYGAIDKVPLILPPGRPDDGQVPVPLLREHIENLRNENFGIIIYGIVCYRDVLSNERHESRFCTLGRKPPGGKGIMFKVGGPKAYNRYT